MNINSRWIHLFDFLLVQKLHLGIYFENMMGPYASAGQTNNNIKGV